MPLPIIKYFIKSILNLLKPKFIHQNWIEIDSQRLLSNYDTFTDFAKYVFPVLKSNAYGHGITQVAKILKQRDFPYIVIDGYFEAMQIQKVSSQPVLVMSYIDPENFVNMDFSKTAFVVQNVDIVQSLGNINRKVKVHLEINTGMNRWGCSPAEILPILELIRKYPKIELEGVMSHLADSDGGNNFYLDYQSKLFDECVNQILISGFDLKYIHLAQSAGSVKANSKFANAIRVGIGLYGFNPLLPSDKDYSKLNDNLPVASFYSKIIKIIDLNIGDSVGYNCTWKATKKTRIAVIPTGYYEGLSRDLTGTCVKINGTYCKIVGRICMNITMIEISTLECKIGDIVQIFSSNLQDKNSIENTSNHLKTIPHTLLTSWNHNVAKTIV